MKRDRLILSLFALSFVAFAFLIMLGLKRVEAASEGMQTRNYAILLSNDFCNDWTAAKLVQMGQVATLFDDAAYFKAMQSLWQGPLEVHNWSYPPSILTLLRPLALFSPVQALLVWSLVGLLFYYVTLRLAPVRLPGLWQVLVLASPASLVNLVHGQTGFYTASFFLGGLYWLKQRSALSGVAFGLLTLKPHLGFLLAPLLLCLRQWRAIAVAVVAAGVLIGVSLVWWGTEPWVHYFQHTVSIQVGMLEHFDNFSRFMMPGMVAGQRLMGIPLALAWVGYAVLALPIAGVVMWLLCREGMTSRAVLAFSLGSLLVTPYGFNYDMTAISLALVLYLYEFPPQTVWKWVCYLFLWGAPVFVYVFGFAGIPLVSVMMVAALVVLCLESKPGASRPGHSASV